MKAIRLEQLESWGWRALMPALLLGGNAAGITLFVVAILRTAAWWSGHRSVPWGWRRGAIWWVAYFGLQLLGGLWSSDLSAWSLSLEVKSALWFLPVLLAMPGRSVLKDFWWSVGWSLTAYLTWRLLRAGWHHLALGAPSEWRYARLSGDVHPTYLSLHIAVAMLGLGKQWGQELRPVGLWGVTVMYALVLGMLGSKAGVLAVLAVVGLRLAMMWPAFEARSWGRMSRSLAAGPWRWMAFFALVVMSTWWMSSKRFVELSTAAAVVQDSGVSAQSSSAGRVVVWQASWELLKAHPFGVGTGDVVPELMRIYTRDGHDYAADRELNPHNQWLQAGVAFGWPGVLILTLAFLSCAWWSWKTRDGLLLLCILLAALHAGVESVLEVQRGVVFILWMMMVALPVRGVRRGA